ncbi:AI-2E family transporter [Burkholderia sp. Bp8998]|uniref:AI-2E family transporter n=1 Tax=Burkholderia sp. Bp8998 TaxID=2184557 RepID=UPI000F5A0406|nr:AI-2E family transporter [Burkholderia sp. Bp8998]RQS09430.1 AI-2E family transporter [Burkholderia sp. Bp8998]
MSTNPPATREPQQERTRPHSYQRQAVLCGALAVGLGVLMWTLRPVLTPFLLGGLIAYMLQPGVEWLVRQRIPRSLAALVMMLLFASVIVSLGLLVFAVIQKELPALAARIPGFAAQINAWLQPKLAMFGLNGSFDLSSLRNVLTSRIEGGEQSVQLAAWRSVRTGGSALVAVVGNVVVVPLVLYYLLYDRRKFFARIESLVPRPWLGKTYALVTEMDQILSQYLRGQLLVMVVLATFYPIALGLAGFGVALPVGVFTGLAVFIPYVGFATGLVLALLAALLQFGDWYGFGAVALIYGIGQVLETAFLTPRLIGERIGLHPLAAIFALLAFGQLFGFFGVLLALPVSAILATALREVRRRYLASTLYANGRE